MKDLETRFNSFREDFPSLGDVIIMSMAVEEMRYSKEIIRKSFDTLISKDEYDKAERDEIIRFLVNYSQSEKVYIL